MKIPTAAGSEFLHLLPGSCGIHTEISSQGILGKGTESDRADASGSVSAEGCGTDRRESGGGPHAHLRGCAATIQHRDGDRVSQRE